MNLTKKFIIIIVMSVVSIITVNILAIFIYSNSLFESYLANKNNAKREVTLEYINSLIDKETNEYIDNLFIDVEKSFFELLEKNEGKVSLEEEKNVNIIVNYLLENGVSPKYIQEIIPKNNILSILSDVKNVSSPEHKFIFSLLRSIIITNIIIILLTILYILFFIKRTLAPINYITTKIRQFKSNDKFNKIEYNKNDEIGLLVSSINNLNEDLQKQEKIRHKFLTDISHELKTPITAIRCYLEGISDGVIKVNSENIDKITEEMSRLVNLVNMIMEYEKFENKTLNLNLQEKNVRNLIENTVLQYENNLKQTGQKIDIEASDVKIKLDEEKFMQIVHNVISNFLKYSGEKTTLKIKIKENYIEFKDDGKGIKQSKIQFLTEKFYQGDPAKSGQASERGIGVGLSIVEKIIKAHNWKIFINSGEKMGFSIKIFTQSSH